MSVNLITGYAGEAHITAEGDGAVNYGMYGSGKYVLNVGETFDYEIISNNLIQVKSGYAINQGRKIELAVNDYEELEIDNGLQGVKRCDLIVIHYEKNLTTGIETATMEVIKGTSGDDYVDPEYTSGDIINGANEDDFLLYRVKIDGLSIDSVEALFTVTDSLLDLLATKDKEIAGLKSLLGSSTLTTTAKTCTGAINELDEKIDEANTKSTTLSDNVKGSIKSVSSGAAGSLGSGIYYLGANVTGVPLSSGGMLICSEASSSGNKVQTFFSISTSEPYEIYKRTYSGKTSSWSSWYALGIDEARKWHATTATVTFDSGANTASVTISGVTSGCPVIAERVMSSSGSKYIIGASATTNTITLVLNEAVSSSTSINVSIMYYC